MKKLITIFTFILFIAFFGYQNKTIVAQEANKILYHSSCDTPIPYSIGTIDERFNISRSEFKERIDESGDIWSSAYGKQLFTYDPDAVMTVSLVYDERQSLNNQINALDTDLKNQDKTLKPEIAEFERRSAEFKRKMRELNQEIDSWNSKGGAPEEEYNKLKDRQIALQQEADTLNAIARSLNQSTNEFNSQVQDLNQTVDSYNDILQYKPEEGIYIENGKERAIIVYFNNSKQELIHTLAHEMGHALGMEHTSNTQAIMFSRTNNIVSPSTDDIASLAAVCRKRSLLETGREKLEVIINNLQQAASN